MNVCPVCGCDPRSVYRCDKCGADLVDRERETRGREA
jgi:uncharacterized membrane protein YvbJ